MNLLGTKKMLNAFWLFFAATILPSQLQAQCDSIDVSFTFSYLSEDTVLILNTTEGFDTYEWSVEGGQLVSEYDHSLFIIQQADSLIVCLTGKTKDDCRKTLCKPIYPGDEDDLCLLTDCIWPGDANGDLKANQYDLLNIGLGLGASGPARSVFPIPGDPIFWAPSYNVDWGQATGIIDYKHLDCDGNGIIEEDDLLAIYKNYTPATDLKNKTTEGAAPIELALKSAIEYQGDAPTKVTITGELLIGSLQIPVEDLHGLALRLRFPNQPFEIESIQASVDGSGIMGAPEEVLMIAKRLEKGLKEDWYDLSVSKKNTSGSNGFGKAVSISIISADIIELINAPATPFKVTIEGLIMINAQGDTLQYDIPVDTACVNFIENITTASKEERLSTQAVQVMPNPSTGLVTILTQPGIQLLKYTLINAAGQVIEIQNVEGRFQQNINLHPYRPGWYFIKIETDKGVLSKRILKIK